MGGPGTPGFAMPAGEDWIPRKLRDLERQIRENAAARTLESSSIGAGGIRSSDFNGTGPDNPGTSGWMIGRIPGGDSYLIMSGRLVVQGDTTIAGLLSIVGPLIVTGPTKIAGTLDVTGDAVFSGDTTIGGNAAITGTLSLPAGVIDNDALASPVTGGVAPTVTATGWSVSTTMTTKATTSIAIPAGFTRAIVNAQASMYFQDSAANGAWVDAVIAGNAGAEMGGLANLSLGQAAFHTRDITGLTGGSITLEARVRASAASSTNLTARFIQIGGSATFFR